MILTLFAFSASHNGVSGQHTQIILWLLLLLSCLLSPQHMLVREEEQGILDQWRVLSLPLEWVVCIKWLVAWVMLTWPLLLFAPLALVVLGIEQVSLSALCAAFALASASITALITVTSALTLRISGSGQWASIMVVPLIIPVLLFGQGALNAMATNSNAWLLLAGSTMFMVPAALLASAYLLRHE